MALLNPQMRRWILLGGFFALGLIIFGYLSYMLSAYPLFNFAVSTFFAFVDFNVESYSAVQVDNLDWTREWLYMTILDYYGCAVCLSVIAVLTEDVPYGILWALGFCFLGSPVACLYMVMRLAVMKGISLRDRDPCPTPTKSGTNVE